nr:unnamed protein product [Callosobruchus analis]
MEGRPIVESSSIKLLGMNINNNMPWHDHVVTIAKTVSQMLGVLFRCRKLYTPEQLLLLYKTQIRPSLEYCSHVWGCAPKHSLKLMDSIQKRAVRLIDTPILTKDLHSLERMVARIVQDLFRTVPQDVMGDDLPEIMNIVSKIGEDRFYNVHYVINLPKPGMTQNRLIA